MAKQRVLYVCSACGGEAHQWQGQCRSCGEWNTLVERAAPARPKGGLSATSPSSLARPVALADVDPECVDFLQSGLEGLDELLGGGLAPGASLLLGGEPGVGKSTLLLQLAGAVARQKERRKVLYVSGEESLDGLARRARRLGAALERIDVLCVHRLDEVLESLATGTYGLVILDSVQTLVSPRAEGLPGAVSQVRAVATEAIEAAQAARAALVLVGHVTKDGQLAGPKLLEHMVDVVLSLEGEKRTRHRILRALKNRFGPADDLLVLSMVEDGLAPVADPATIFLTERDPSLSGAAVVMALDGRRPFAVEVQALASRSFLSIPRRTALGLDVNRLHLLLAVVEKRLSISLSDADVYAKVGGGLKTTDPGLDLGFVAAVLSSFYEIALPERSAFFGEVDLNGHVRPVAGMGVRLGQAEKLGYTPIFRAPGEEGGGGRKIPGGIRTIADLARTLFGAG